MILESIIGTIAGFIGTGITTYANYKMKSLEIEDNKAKREHELNMVQAESEARIAEVQAQIHVAQVQTEGAITLEEARGFTESQRVGNEKVFESRWVATLMNRKDGWRYLTVPLATIICTLFGFSDALQSIMRPGLTIYSGAIATWVTWQVWEVMQRVGIDAFSVAQAVTMWDQASSVAYTLCITLFTWWFGDRRVAKNLMHQSKNNSAKTR
ncbi:MAG: hypothetical protein LBV80_00730 [Deltaproteobacteria bacterium]|jgi:hypothetical protein|nr:hypothetical protein [Deltaproteobacteria bacterium]